ncbi:FxsA family protein [Paludifilum halophilum]|uniref:Membrane protein FxsA n=1 Tax=Paludifilum halophilum TaxID=1642702 RepID=A0A235B819_9BACL|nr:FxsA family protein [Paludifilum halophilum]OYD08401.1 membrane protein FxsA [Paludifilum halophilum]
MFRLIILALILIPALEIWGLVTVGSWIGAWPTVLAVIVTGVVGGYLARWQGLQTIRLAQIQLRNNELPGEALLEGICILSGGLLLLTPGFFTDAFGFLLLIPYTRGMIKLVLKRWLNKMIAEGRVYRVDYRRW